MIMNRLFGKCTARFSESVVMCWIFLVCALAAGCDSPFETKASRKFIIAAGEHYSNPRLFETFTDNNLTFRATFDASAKYDLGDASLQSNINKLMGFSDCNSLHHENSARFGWKWENERLDIYAYCYVDSVRIHQYVGTVQLHEENLYEIAAKGNEYMFSLNGKVKVAIRKAAVCEEGAKYMLYPYFGGSVPAPHDVTVKIEIVP
jgi:hypothetical protein